MTLGPGHSLNGNWIGSLETAAICVPSGYTVWPHYGENYTIWTGLSVVSPATGGRTWDGTSMVPAFEVRWAASDLPILTAALSPTTALSPSRPTSGLPAPTASDSLPPGPATETGESAGLSRGTIAGIAVGLVVALALVLAAVGWFLLRRYRRERMKPQHTDAELDVGDSGGQRPSELYVEKG